MQGPQTQDPSLAGRIARTLAGRIVTGELKPGAPVRQDHVAAEFETSHVPVREAFRRLEAQGYLVSAPRRGVRVAPLDPKSVTEITEMRAALEALALSHAFPNLGPADFETAAQAIAQCEESTSIAVWEQANRRFHEAITAPCGLPRLSATIGELHQAAARLLYATWKDLDWQPRSDDEHRAILESLKAGDVAKASDLLCRHILEAGRALARSLEKAGD